MVIFNVIHLQKELELRVKSLKSIPKFPPPKQVGKDE